MNMNCSVVTVRRRQLRLRLRVLRMSEYLSIYLLLLYFAVIIHGFKRTRLRGPVENVKIFYCDAIKYFNILYSISIVGVHLWVTAGDGSRLINRVKSMKNIKILI